MNVKFEQYGMKRSLSLMGLKPDLSANESVKATDSSPTTGTTVASRRRRLWKSFKTWRRQRSSSRDRSRTSPHSSNSADINVTSISQPDLSHVIKLSDSFNYKLAFQDVNRTNVVKLLRGESINGPSSQQQTNVGELTVDEKSLVADDSEEQAAPGVNDTLIASISPPATDSKLTKTKTSENHLQLVRLQPFYVLDVVLKEGRDLVIRDACGTSDPYVLFRIGNKQFYRSRIVFKNLNPSWNERFSIPIEDPFKPINILVYDYDRSTSDDFMGSSSILPAELEINETIEQKLLLRDDNQKGKNAAEYMGYLIIQLALIPKTQADKELYLGRLAKQLEQCKKYRLAQMWSSVVNIRLIDGHDLLSMDDNGLSDPYVKFKLGNERYKSRVRPKTLNPVWLEQFDFYMFDDQTSYLEVSVWDHDTGGRDEIMGRAEVDLSSLEPDKTHKIEVSLDDNAGSIQIFVTISGLTGYQCSSDVEQAEAYRQHIIGQYGFLQSFSNIDDVGTLIVKVIKAQGLMAADIGGKSDPFCVLELINTRLQTRTEYKTLSPEWNKEFIFAVNDLHSVLEVTVFDEDRDKKCDFLGKLAIPLLKVRNGQKCWYQLKDRKLLCRMKGAILLELHLVYNQVKAAIRTFNPREQKYLKPDAKFRISVMRHNVDRVKLIVDRLLSISRFMHSCFEWQNKLRSILAFVVFLVVVWNFELYMLPITLLLVFVKNLLFVRVSDSLLKDSSSDVYFDEDVGDVDDDFENKDGKKSFRDKLHAVQETCLQIQEYMDHIACLAERVKNSTLWTVPWLSWLAVIVLSIASVILYFVPIRYLVLLWGINKFTKRLRSPNYIPNNELLDYLSRAPSDRELVQFRELRPDQGAVVPRKKQL